MMAPLRRRLVTGLALAWVCALAVRSERESIAQDATPAEPPLVVESPVPGAHVRRDVDLVGHVKHAAAEGAAQLFVNGVETPVKDGRFQTAVHLENEGPTAIRVVYGETGKPATVVSLHVTVDATP